MRLKKSALVLALPLFLSCAPAGARFVLAPGFPWTYSVTGSETVTSLAMDSHGWVWTAGNVYSPTYGRDLLALVWTRTHPGEPFMKGQIDGTFAFLSTFWGITDEGEPKLGQWLWIESSGNQRSYAVIACSEKSGAQTHSAVWLIEGYFTTTTGKLFEFPGGLPSEPLGLGLEGSGTPYVTGSVTQGGVKQMLYYRNPRDPSGGSYNLQAPVTATWWTGSTVPLEGRGIVTQRGKATIVGTGGGDVWLFRYKDEPFADPTPVDMKATIDPAFDPPQRVETAAVDEPRAMKRDVHDDLWVVGSSDGSAAVWKFSEDGGLLWMVKPLPGTASDLYALDFDALGNCIATGTANNGLVLLTIGAGGGLLDDARPPAEADTVTGRGLTVNADGTVWVGATLSSAPSSAVWSGTAARLYYFAPDLGPATVARGGVTLRIATGAAVRGPSGVINPRTGERLSILARAAEGGTVRAQVMTMRGEVIAEFSESCAGGGVVEFIWDGRTARGGEAATGVYLLRVSGGGIRTMKKVVVSRNK